MEDMCATCNAWFCLAHVQGSFPDADRRDFLTGGGPSTEVERPPCIDPRSSNFLGYDDFNSYQPPTSDPQSGTSVEGPYLLDPQSQYPPHPTTYRVLDGNHPGAFNYGHNSAYLGDAVPGQPRRGLTIDVSGIGHQVAPSLPSASTDATVCLSAIEQYVPASLPPSPQKYVPPTQHIVSRAVREAANKRRKKVLSHFCTDCGAAFTSSHNLRYHYDSKHKGQLNYPCKYYEQGCKYRAAAPRTATRHSLTCKAKPVAD